MENPGFPIQDTVVLCYSVTGHTTAMFEDGYVQVQFSAELNGEDAVDELFGTQTNETFFLSVCSEEMEYWLDQDVVLEAHLSVSATATAGHSGIEVFGHAEGNFMGTMVLTVLDLDPYYLEHSESGTSYPIVELPFVDHFELGDFIAWSDTIQ